MKPSRVTSFIFADQRGDRLAAAVTRTLLNQSGVRILNIAAGSASRDGVVRSLERAFDNHAANGYEAVEHLRADWSEDFDHVLLTCGRSYLSEHSEIPLSLSDTFVVVLEDLALSPVRSLVKKLKADHRRLPVDRCAPLFVPFFITRRLLTSAQTERAADALSSMLLPWMPKESTPAAVLASLSWLDDGRPDTIKTNDLATRFLSEVLDDRIGSGVFAGTSADQPRLVTQEIEPETRYDMASDDPSFRCAYGIVPEESVTATGLFRELEDAMDWALKRYGNDEFRIRYVEVGGEPIMAGGFAVQQDGTNYLDAIFPTVEDALTWGHERFGSGQFSVRSTSLRHTAPGHGHRTARMGGHRD